MNFRDLGFEFCIRFFFWKFSVFSCLCIVLFGFFIDEGEVSSINIFMFDVFFISVFTSLLECMVYICCVFIFGVSSKFLGGLRFGKY